MNAFIFFSSKQEIRSNLNEKIIKVNKNIMEKHELFNLFYTELSFPSYFGRNWDALYDCLSDLSWIKKNRILIIHEDIPFASTPIEKKNYIELLSDLIISWQDNKTHILSVYFPEKCKKEIEELLINQ